MINGQHNHGTDFVRLNNMVLAYETIEVEREKC